MKRSIGLIFFWFLFVSNVFCQSQALQFRSFTNEQGLSQNSVYSISQTPEGFIWVGTIDGLNRFDGKNFRTFYPTLPDNTPTSSIIYSTYLDQDQHFFVGTAEQLFLFFPKRNQFRLASAILEGLDLPDNLSITQVIEDRTHRIWISTLAHGLFCYDKKQKLTTSFLQEDLLRLKVTGMCTTPNGQVLISTQGNIFRSTSTGIENLNIDFSHLSNRPNVRCITSLGNQIAISLYDIGLVICQPTSDQTFIAEKKEGIPYPEDIISMHSEGDSILWLGSRSKGVLKVKFPEQEWAVASVNSKSSGLKSNFILNTFQDRQHNIWLGLSGGGLAVNSQEEKIFDWVRPTVASGDPNGDNMIFGMAEYDESTIYMGSLNYGLKEYFPKTGKLNYYFDQDLPAQASNIYDLIIDGQQIWLATWAGLCSFDLKKKTFQNWTKGPEDGSRFYSIFALNKNQLLLGGEDGLFVFDKRNQSFSKPTDKNKVLNDHILITRFIEILDGEHLLLATSDRGLVKYHPPTGTFTFFPELEKISSACRHLSVGEQYIFLATEDGLIQINRSDFSIKKHFTIKDGLSNDFCYAVIPATEQQLWISTNGGLSRINLDTDNIKNFGLTDGLQDLEFNSASCLQTKNNKIIFGGINGFNVFDPLKIPKGVVPKMPQLIEIKVMNESFETKEDHSFLEKIELPHFQNFLSLEFSCLSEIYKNSINYQYQLVGVDPQWIDNGTRTFANYTNLDAGIYNFKVRATVGDERFSMVNDQLEIEIKPAYWETWWFRLLSVATLFLGGFLLYRNRIKRLKNQVDIERKMERLESMALRLQMNPHFLFNTLNSIKHYAVFRTKEETSDFISDFSTLMRMILENSRHNFISLASEIDLIKLYISIEQRRLKDSFEFQFFCDKNIQIHEKQIPPMLIQPFVENAIWHGLMHKEVPKKLTINLTSQEDGFNCEIVDNGIGRVQHAQIKNGRKKESLATNIAMDRLSLLTQNNTGPNQIEVVDLYDDEKNALGTKVTIIIRA